MILGIKSAEVTGIQNYYQQKLVPTFNCVVRHMCQLPNVILTSRSPQQKEKKATSSYMKYVGNIFRVQSE